MKERLEDVLGMIFEVDDNIDAMIYLLKMLELLYEFEEDREKRYLLKTILFMLTKIQGNVDTAAKTLDEIIR